MLGTLVRHARRLGHADAAGIWLGVGDRFRAVAMDGWIPDERARYAEDPDSDLVSLFAGQPLVQLVDGVAVIGALSEAHAKRARYQARAYHVGAELLVPVYRGVELRGAFLFARRQAAAFSEREIALVQSFADQAAIAIESVRLLRETQQKRAELEDRNRELAEALAQQTAASEILGIISTSPTDLQPVFSAVAERAQRLLSADTGTIILREGDGGRLVAEVGPTPRAALNQPVPRSWRFGDGPFALAVREARAVHLHGSVEEVAQEQPLLAGGWRAAGYERRTLLVVPLLHGGMVLGVIGVGRADGVPFTERQIALLETFAAQVVIAMQNTRLFNELAQSNRGLAEALER